VAKSPQVPSDGTASVDAFMAALQHPLKADIEVVRRTILGASPAITEEIKWNAPGFRTIESFATVNLRSADQVQLIFHLGAKVRPGLKPMKIADPAGLMKWLGKDRAMVTLGAGKTLKAHGPALQAIVRGWITFL